MVFSWCVQPLRSEALSGEFSVDFHHLYPRPLGLQRQGKRRLRVPKSHSNTLFESYILYR
jgi:hypothetical protein